jgi:hypoxanthine phosphoribosyltransferase
VLGIPRKLDRATIEELARELARRLAPFEPAAVIYLERGGALPGRAIARRLRIPWYPLEIHYPATGVLRSLPRPLGALAVPFKELCYRLTAPRPARRAAITLPPPDTRVVLVDDSASSGRTLRVALALLAARGFDRERVRVVVLRCGRRARGLVDCYAVAEPVRFPAVG